MERVLTMVMSKVKQVMETLVPIIVNVLQVIALLRGTAVQHHCQHIIMRVTQIVDVKIRQQQV